LLSLKKFQRNLYEYVKLSVHAGMPIELVIEGKVYFLRFIETDKKPELNVRTVTRQKTGVNPRSLKFQKCPACGRLRVEKICLNPECSTVKK